MIKINVSGNAYVRGTQVTPFLIVLTENYGYHTQWKNKSILNIR